ncbi:MAG: TerC/Alx family metal homeostasis membrane protein [Prevotella sp.]|nr:TerC/Alx family metal homeostasis membrane protein [Prevotella sp.]
MFSTEIIFFIIFIAAIVGILLIDMLVIDRKAHEVSIKEAGIWTAVWVALAFCFGGFLWFHGDMVHGIENMGDLQEVTRRYASHLKLNVNDFEGGLALYHHNMTITYLSAYLLEKTLSVDNLFVMLLIFTSFGVSKKEYQHVLNWGILGAIILRFIFIFVGTSLIARFDWILLIFGLLLIYNAIKILFEKETNEPIDVENHFAVRWLSKVFRIYPRFHGDHFFVRAKKTDDNYEVATKRQGGRWCITPLFITVVFIEFADIIFAFDSIPAAFSVSLDPYVVFFSNILAIVGLRAMFFLLAGIADKFRYLKHGVCVLLLFIGAKLLLHNYMEIDAVWSLAVIASVLVFSILLSLVRKH